MSQDSLLFPTGGSSAKPFTGPAATGEASKPAAPKSTELRATFSHRSKNRSRKPVVGSVFKRVPQMNTKRVKSCPPYVPGEEEDSEMVELEDAPAVKRPFTGNRAFIRRRSTEFKSLAEIRSRPAGNQREEPPSYNNRALNQGNGNPSELANGVRGLRVSSPLSAAPFVAGDQPSRIFDHLEEAVSLKNTEDMVEDSELEGLGESSDGAEIPLDWSVKTQARFTSDHEFDWCKVIGSRANAFGVHLFATGTSDEALEVDLESTQLHQAAKFRTATLYYQHPAQPAPFQPGARGIPQTQALNDYFAMRWAEWSESFVSLYHLFSNDLCPYFYLNKPGVCTILFQGAHVGGGFDSRAVISRSSRTLRRALVDQDIHFSMPFHPEETPASVNLVSAPTFETEDGLTIKRAGTASSITDGGPDSQLVVWGSANVHALFDFLLNDRPSMQDVPQLSSMTSFVNASMKHLEVVNTSSVLMKDDSNPEGLTKMYTLELSGPILPTHVNRLCSVLRSSQVGEFQCTFKTNPFTRGLNVGTSTTPDTQDSVSMKPHPRSHRPTPLRNSHALQRSTRTSRSLPNVAAFDGSDGRGSADRLRPTTPTPLSPKVTGVTSVSNLATQLKPSVPPWLSAASTLRESVLAEIYCINDRFKIRTSKT